MYKEKKILAVVTARGGSKGLPGKNIRPLFGKPLIIWTLEQAKASRYIDELFVSTDSREIADVCESYGVAVPHLRPDNLAADGTSSVDVLDYSIRLLEGQGKQFDYVLLLEPTSPLRKKGDLDAMIKLAVEHSERDGVISVGRVHLEHPMIVKKITEQGTIGPYMQGRTAYQRQQHDEALFPYGVGYLIKTNVLQEHKAIYTDNILPYYIDRWQNYEVDDIYDFICIEALMKERGKLL